MATASLPMPEVRRRVLARLLEKHDPAKLRHKPLSLLRPEIRRAAEQLLDTEAGPLPPAERERLLDDLLGDLPGIGPLEELFRDETVSEFLILAHNQIIRRHGESWLPTSVQFRDAEQCRNTLKKLLQSGTPIGDVPKTSDGGADAKLANGFRLIAILPPRALGLAPMAVFRRSVEGPEPAIPAPVKAPSGIEPSSLSRRNPDPWERLRQRITERLIQRLAANGVFDISALPVAELQRVIASYVTEFSDLEKLNLDGGAQSRLTLEILTGMKR